jgi:tetratricopeptide (TPR) repeat protein
MNGAPDPDACDVAVAAHLGASAGGDWLASARGSAVCRAIAQTLRCAPPELGVGWPADPALADARATLLDLEPGEPVEARVCRLWLCDGGGTADAQAWREAAAALAPVVFAPVRALAFRALAWHGLRATLAGVLRRNGVAALPETEAALEAAADATAEPSRALEDGPWPAALAAHWRSLLAIEGSLAAGADASNGLAALRALPAAPHDSAWPGEADRLDARVAAAAARAEIALGRSGEAALAAADALPVWERRYLVGVGHWRVGDFRAARRELTSARDAGPGQTCTRLALAALIAPNEPHEALRLLECDEPTRELLIARAALLARLGRFEEAELALSSAATAPPEAPRQLWPNARRRWREQAQHLEAGLRERRGDFAGAETAWKAAAPTLARGVAEARRVFLAAREQKSLSPAKAWRRDVLEQRLRRGLHEIKAAALPADGLFFRALSSLESDASRAGKDLASLLRRRAWVDAEARSGGGRLIAVGDALLLLGEGDDALVAYERASAQPDATLRERRAVAQVQRELRRGSSADALSRALEHARSLAPASAWPPLLGALAFALVGRAERTRAEAAAAEAAGAPIAVCRCLRALAEAAAGQCGGEVAAADIDALGLPPAAAATLRLLLPCGSESEALEALRSTLGPRFLAECPRDPREAARRLLAARVEGGRVDEAVALATEFLSASEPWARQLLDLVRVCRALERAARGELGEARDELEQLKLS